MKKFKKMFAVLAASALVAAMPLTAMAASITIESGAKSGETDTTTYKYYQVLKASIDGNNVAYYVENEALAHAIEGTNFFNVTQSADSTRWNVVAKQDYSTMSDQEKDEAAKAIAAAFNTEVIKNAVKNARQKYSDDNSIKQNGGGSSVTINDLDDGYYLIESSLGKVLAVQTAGSNGVTIKEKNVYPTLTKTEDLTTAAYGQNVTYTVNVTIPENVDTTKDIKVFDTMTKGLTPYDGADEDALLDVTAKVDNTEITGLQISEVSSDNDGNQTITITLPSEVVSAQKGKTVTLTYKAVVNNQAVVNTAETNKAHLEYDHYTSVETEPVGVKTYGFQLTKKDGKGTEATDDDVVIPESAGDAEFSLWTAENGGTQIQISVKNADTNTYQVLTGNETSTSIKAGGVNGHATAKVEGLAAGTYYLQEDKAPMGYNKLTKRVAITVNLDTTTENNAIDVPNNAGVLLPSTGGIGTTVFAVAGLVIMAGAAAVLIIKKRS
ncbi:SpaH/EbpB family LPXTG-anchored major pilin [Oribacterium sp. HCP28S3_H8]|uniref:SpaH/EbpB family LPXTG-anchored major pilin n=1 Tax=Oribacterium sp. HCP28S3_H8 TaxID=3438945 RepID=UPI003F8C6DE9